MMMLGEKKMAAVSCVAPLNPGLKASKRNFMRGYNVCLEKGESRPGEGWCMGQGGGKTGWQQLENLLSPGLPAHMALTDRYSSAENRSPELHIIVFWLTLTGKCPACTKTSFCSCRSPTVVPLNSKVIRPVGQMQPPGAISLTPVITGLSHFLKL